MFRNLLIVALGGGAGSMLRYLLSLLLPNSVQTGFPLGTLVANMAGCAILGFVYGLLSQVAGMNQDMRLLLGTGLCGGLTTFSTFMYETSQMTSLHHQFMALGYVFVSITAGLLAIALGGWVARML